MKLFIYLCRKALDDESGFLKVKKYMQEEILIDLGLTKNEVKIYLTLLRKGTLSVYSLAQDTGFHRQSIYDGLERLQEKGFVSFVHDVANRKKFFALHPEKLLDYAQEKAEAVQSLIPGLCELSKLAEEQTFVNVFKGKEIMKMLFQDIIKEMRRKPGEILVSGVDEGVVIPGEGALLQRYLASLRSLKCRERVLIKEGDLNMVKGWQTTYRWVPPALFAKIPIHIYNDCVAILVIANPLFLIRINNELLADSLRKKFNLLWDNSKPIPNGVN